MTVLEEMIQRSKSGKVHMTLIDPASKPPQECARIAEEAEMAGTDFIMVGGSTDIDMRMMDEAITAIKDRTDLKVIIFPGSSLMISSKADAIFFMSLLNSGNIDYVVGHQVKAAIPLSSMPIEKIPMAYLVFYPGMTVGRVSQARLIPRDDENTALSYALAAQYLGFRLLYFEAGSGSPYHVSENVIKRVKSEVQIPIIVGGGIRTAESAKSLALAGADMIVTGTITERASNVYEALHPIIESIKEIGLSKIH
ncbi:geranylgeranylglyceryl/heptaprenylglyceryl phosphate synthase [Thermoplasma sp. Kam2015]|uniref:geranylgeranylglyceryl/heptaprenylglyceryl phosphate synthase n=1 Tax=Thermoplasma sp. Kam2015 TaxID=2094122 RepID=UPI00191C82A9|nr:geranylgeranylglyceryl/heptaprenylglyceryl phosphate synthase [Thermoplasma sp. Kam2015]